MGSPIVHFEIIGKDAAQLKEFYTQLFDWKIGDLMPDMGNYGLIDWGLERPGRRRWSVRRRQAAHLGVCAGAGSSRRRSTRPLPWEQPW